MMGYVFVGVLEGDSELFVLVFSEKGSLGVISLKTCLWMLNDRAQFRI